MRPFNFLLILLAFNFTSCVFSKLKEAKKEVITLTEQKKNAENQHHACTDKIKKASAEKDSLNTVIAELVRKSQEPRDSETIAAGAAMQIERLRSRTKNLLDTISIYQRALTAVYGIEGNKAGQVTFKGQKFDYYIANTKNCKIQLFWRDETDNKPYLSLKNLRLDLETNDKKLVFASNAGMYLSDNSPQGLFVQNGVEIVPVDKKKDGYGNFYMQPNGIFYLDAADIARVLTTEQYMKKKPKSVKFATQSGPMLLVEGIINSNFTRGSDNKNIRNGVGIIDSNLVVFVISNERVNLYDFASLFKDQFKCQNALYLDGAISETYLPELARHQQGGNFGPMIGIFK